MALSPLEVLHYPSAGWCTGSTLLNEVGFNTLSARQFVHDGRHIAVVFLRFMHFDRRFFAMGLADHAERSDSVVPLVLHWETCASLACPDPSIAGVLLAPVQLASGPFAMLDDGPCCNVTCM